MAAKGTFQVLSFNDLDLKVRLYKRRNFHLKARSGCLTCKSKRVKCDESRPTCARCWRNNRPCAYSQPTLKAGQSISSSDSGGPFSISSLSALTVVPFSSPSVTNGTSNLDLVQHSLSHWTEIFHIAPRDDIVSLSKSHSLVSNTLLAIAACHLRHMSPGNLRHRIAEHFQQSLALRDYQRMLSTPQDRLSRFDVDALLLAGALLNILAFALPESETAAGNLDLDPRTSWVFSTSEDRLSWVKLQVGLKYLTRSTTVCFDEALTFIGPIFLGPGRESWVSRNLTPSLDGIPQSWITVFELYEGFNSDHDNGLAVCDQIGNVFHAAISTLIKLRNLEPEPLNTFVTLQFLGKLRPEFCNLLYERDERALWLFGYWLGLMCRFREVWWCERRVRRDYKAICVWLDQLCLTERQGIEGRMWKELMRDLALAPVCLQT